MSRKFENNPLAERLYKLSLDGCADAEIGSVDDYGWYGLFAEDGAILYEDTDGNVFIETGTDESISKTWAERQADYDEWMDYEYDEYDTDLYDEYEE